MKSIVILDDYQNVALTFGAWDKLAGRATIKVLNRHIASQAELTAELADANVIVANRERTVITDALLATLPKLELIVTSGMRNASSMWPPPMRGASRSAEPRRSAIPRRS